MPLRKLRVVIAPLTLIAILALAWAISSGRIELSYRGDDSGSITTLPDGTPEEFSRLFEVLDVLQRAHFQRDSLDANELTRAAIRGMLEALDDPYAAYLTPGQQRIQSQNLKGFFEGIGAEVGVRDGEITILAPIPGTPADRAGVRPGDIILEIYGESTEGLTLMEAVNIIRGPKGEPVDLTIRHRGDDEAVQVTIIRDVVELRGVRLRMLEGGIAHLRITHFSETTNTELAEALGDIRNSAARGIILDVRNNPGGLLESVVDVTSQFLDDGIVLYEMSGEGELKERKVRAGGLATDIPLVVLVNEFSASGSEVLAGALKDHKRAPVIGVKTFGKGSVNTIRELSDGSGLTYTISRWLTPEETLIEGEGLEPDIVAPQPQDSGDDVQLEKAIEVLEAQLGAL